MIKFTIHSKLDENTLAASSPQKPKDLLEDIRQDSMAGWLTLPDTLDKAELEHIKAVAKNIRETSDFLVCIGIGGSYLGHRAVIEALQHELSTQKTKILYAGNSLSELSLQKILDEIGDKDFSINVISKSGTTTEPAIAFRIFKQKLIEKYGETEAYKRIIATTDANKGALHDEAEHNHYETFVIPDNIGGRYSVLTPVGLLPLAAAGVDLDRLLSGAREEYIESTNEPSMNSAVFRYAYARHTLRTKNSNTNNAKDTNVPADTEVLSTFEPSLCYVSEWWKQLFGESEGKENSGIFPASIICTTDLHSLGQFLQQGRPNIFETFITFKNQPTTNQVTIPTLEDNLDGLQYLEGRPLTEINKQAERATIIAHAEHLPVLELELEDLSAKSLGALLYFFELACAASAKLQGVNPFDQPGVERYKNEMFKLLGKPGF